MLYFSINTHIKKRGGGDLSYPQNQTKLFLTENISSKVKLKKGRYL